MKSTELALHPEEQIRESALYHSLKDIFHFDFVAGLPCGELRHFIAESRDDGQVEHLQTTNEREAIGVAQGAWLAGKRPVLYMQNSGLFEASNDLASLFLPCKSSILFVVSWRGAPGETATQHFFTGNATPKLLESFGIPYVTDPNLDNLHKLAETMQNESVPGVILVKREKFNEQIQPIRHDEARSRLCPQVIFDRARESTDLSRETALDILFQKLIQPGDAVVSSTGLISRSAFHHHDSDNQFYNAGAFGVTSSIGLGFANSRKDIRTIVIEGDGSVLTNLGALNVIAHYADNNFVHVVLDNQAYVSCSGEPTYGSDKIPNLARELGYGYVSSVNDEVNLANATHSLDNEINGPKMIHVRINQNGERNFKRPLEMADIATRFRNKFSQSRGR